MLRSLLLLMMTVALSAHAQDAGQALTGCLADNTSGKDRKDLARWVFFAMAAHPEIKPYVSSAATAAEASTDRAVADLFTRLLAENCTKQVLAAVQGGDRQAVVLAFQTLGQLAMQELMSNPDVSASTMRFQKQIDDSKLKKALSAPAGPAAP
jgi:hypothetical protein